MGTVKTKVKSRLVIQHVLLSRLKPWPGNPRTKHDVAAISKSIGHFGFVNPILVQKGTWRVIAGHGRIAAAKKAGLTEVPVVVLDLDDKDAAAYTVADNRLTEKSEWDLPRLKTLLADLDNGSFDLELTGFDADDLARMFDGDRTGEADPDAVPETPARPVTKKGDLIRLGGHRLLCGSATDAKDVARLMDGEKSALVFTDPPYGIAYRGAEGGMTGDDLTGERLTALLLPAFKLAVAHSAKPAAFYVWHGYQTREEFAYALKAAGLVERRYLIWAKPGIMLGMHEYRGAYEPCFYLSKAGETPRFYGGLDEPTVWRIAPSRGGAGVVVGPGVAVSDGKSRLWITTKMPKTLRARVVRVDPGTPARLAVDADDTDLWEVSRDSAPLHPTQKPVEVAERAIRNSSQAGEVVYDPFLGSGTTIIACERTSRVGYGLELDPRFCDVIVDRWERFTSQKAVRERA